MNPLVSSAKSLSTSFVQFCLSLLYNRNNNGPNTDLCSTPQLIYFILQGGHQSGICQGYLKKLDMSGLCQGYLKNWICEGYVRDMSGIFFWLVNNIQNNKKTRKSDKTVQQNLKFSPAARVFSFFQYHAASSITL